MKYPKKPHILNKLEELVTDYAGIDWLYLILSTKHKSLNKQEHRITKKWIGVQSYTFKSNRFKDILKGEFIQS